MSTFLRTFYEYFCQNIAVHLKSKVGKVGTVNIPLSLFTLSLNIKFISVGGHQLSIYQSIKLKFNKVVLSINLPINNVSSAS